MKLEEKPAVTPKGDEEAKKAPAAKDGKKPAEDLSEEDRALSEELELYVKRLQEADSKLYSPALEALRSQIKSSTSSMTAVPKPLKFLRNHYDTLKNLYDKMPTAGLKSMLADVVSILAMTIPATEQNRTNGDSLKFRLLAQNFAEIGSWGHEYVRHLSAEIAWEMKQEKTGKEPVAGAAPEAKAQHDADALLKLVEVIIPYNMNHNAEAEACDLLIDIERTDLLSQYIDSEELCRKVCLYLRAVVPYVPDPENTNLLNVILGIFLKFKKFAQALRVAMQLNDTELVQKIFNEASGDLATQKQLAFMIARQQIPIEAEDGDLLEIASSTQLNNYFLTLGRELDIMEPKQPEDIYKTHLETNTRMYSSNLTSDSARANLASAFVNGFVNCGFGKDKLITTDEGSKYIFKNKDSAMMSATASLGLISLWDVDTGLAPIDKYFYSKDEYIKAGALLACGIVNCGVRHECDPAKALLSEFINDSSNQVRIGAIMGMGLSYAGSNRDDLIQTILQVFQDPKSPADLVGVCAMAMGVISVGAANSEVTTAIIQYLIEKPDLDIKDYFQRFLLYALGMSVLGKQNNCEAIIEALAVIPNKQFKEVAKLIVEICAYAATGNVLKIQQLLQFCAGAEDEKEEKEATKEETSKEAAKDSVTGASSSKATGSKSETSKSSKEKKATSIESESRISEAIATIGIGLISMVDDISCEMSIRMFGHLLRYGSPMVKRAVPLAMALTSISNPKINILETLSKFSHDGDSEVACNAIFAMGLVGAGTNNARLAAMLRQLAQFHAKDQNCLFMVRMAQGLTVLGKSTLTLSPFHSDRQLVLPTAVAALLTTCMCLIDPKYTIIKAHYLLYSLVPAIQPRMLITFDEQLKPLQVTVRVGQAVDTVGQAGRPKTITGFQTHTTPVLLSIGERAELATDEYVALTPILEGFVILRKNPDYKA